MPVYMGVQGQGDFLLAPSDLNPSMSLTAKDFRRRSSANSILRVMGEDAVYNGYLPIRVIHRTNVERFGDSGEIIIDDHQIAFNGAHIPFAREKGQITLNNRTYSLKSPVAKSKEGLHVWVVK